MVVLQGFVVEVNNSKFKNIDTSLKFYESNLLAHIIPI